MKITTGCGQMTERTKSLFLKISILSGYLSYVFHLKKINLLLIVSLVFLLLVIITEWMTRHSHWSILFPFSSGLLAVGMKFFYWDQFDFASRINHLMMIALVFSLGIAFHKFRLLKLFSNFFSRLKIRKKLIFIFVFSEIVLVMASLVLVEKGITLVGDEAHYLVISQSIARDLDLNVFNQYARDQYKDFIPQHLQSHAKVGKGFKKWYSFHLPGLSVTLSPFFIFKLPQPLLYVLIRIYLGLFGALLAVLVYLFSLKLWQNEGLSLRVTLVFCLTSPVIFLSIHIFAEVQALLLILSSVYLLLYGKKNPKLSLMLAGFLLGLTVFWGMKYVIFIYILGIGFTGYFIRKQEYRKILWFILFPVVFQLLFFSYLYLAYGNFSPMSIYTGVLSESQAREFYENVKQISLKNRLETLLDYFFDQRDGLLLYNPFYFFFFPGLIIAIRKFRKYGPHLLLSVASFVYLLYHGFSTVRPGVCPQARYLVPVLWTLMLFGIIYYLETRNRFFKKIFWMLPFYSFFVVGFQLFNPYTLYQTTTHDYLYRPGLMFQMWSSIHLNVSGLLPSFIKSVPAIQLPYFRPSHNEDYIPNIVALLIFLILVVISLLPWKHDRTSWLVAAAFTGLFVLFVLFPRAPLYNPVSVNKNGTIPHLVHGAAFHPGKVSQKKFNIRDSGVFRCLISTRKKAGYISLEVENEGVDKITADLYNFDSRIEGIKDLDAGTRRIVIDNPRFRSLFNRFFYQFTFRIKGDTNDHLRLSIECLPFGK